MAYPDPENQFQKWILTQQEIEDGAVLTVLQKHVIQNQLAMLAERSLGMIVEPGKQYQWSLEQAELQGARSQLQNLLDCSASVENFRNNSPIHTSSQE